jgi:hypothetical protein
MPAGDEHAARQLAALAGVHALFVRDGIDYWVFGGWAVDLHAGAVTRAHDDVDVTVWLADVPRIGAALAAEGWAHAPAEDEDGGTGYERGGVRLELTYLARDDGGAVFTPLRSGPGTWAAGAFAGEVRELRGVRARVIGLDALVAGKSWPRDDPDDLAKDRADLAVLARL